jgi:ribosomal protein L37AE/L43A
MHALQIVWCVLRNWLCDSCHKKGAGGSIVRTEEIRNRHIR